jgi:hypothetical protein
MSSVAREQFRAANMAANASYTVGGPRMGGFIGKTAGAITVTDANGTVLVDAVPIIAGVTIPIPIMFQTGAGAVVTLSGGASGTLLL